MKGVGNGTCIGEGGRDGGALFDPFFEDTPRLPVVRLQLECRAELTCLRGLREQVVWFVGQERQEEEFLDLIRLAIGEGAANAIRHGCRFNPDLHFHVTCWQDQEDCWISIHDPGTGFNPEGVPEPDFLQEGGRGIYLMRRIMDFVDYQFGTEGTTLLMRKCLRQKETSPD